MKLANGPFRTLALAQVKLFWWPRYIHDLLCQQSSRRRDERLVPGDSSAKGLSWKLIWYSFSRTCSSPFPRTLWEYYYLDRRLDFSPKTVDLIMGSWPRQSRHFNAMVLQIFGVNSAVRPSWYLIGGDIWGKTFALRSSGSARSTHQSHLSRLVVVSQRWRGKMKKDLTYSWYSRRGRTLKF